MDLAIEVLKTQYRDEKRIKVKVQWWNLGWTDQVYPFKREKIEIKVEDIKKWKPLESLNRKV